MLLPQSRSIEQTYERNAAAYSAVPNLDASEIQVSNDTIPEKPLLVTLCTYDEKDNLENIVNCILENAPDAHVLVIDDNSPDGTGDIADRLAAKDDRVLVNHRTGKLGLGTATVTGLLHAIDNNYQYVLNLDADFSHHPKHIPALRECMERCDVSIGSRYVKGGGVIGWGLKRHFMSRAINFYARFFLGLKTRDNSGSYRCYRVSQLRRLDFDLVKAKGYAFQEEILYRCHRLGCTFEETPITFDDRRLGYSKINWKEVAAALWWIMRLGIDGWRGVTVEKAQT